MVRRNLSTAGKLPHMPSDPIARLDALTRWPYQRRVLAVVGAAWFFAFFDIVNIGYALPAISEQFGVSSSVVAITVTLSLVGYVIGSLTDGVIADRYGRQLALVLSVSAFSIGTIIAACATDVPLLAIGRFIAGMGIGAEIASATAYVGEISPSGLRGRAGSQAAAWGYAGLALVPFIALLLVPRFDAGWRVLFLIGAAGGLIVLPFRRKLPPSPRWLMARGRVAEADAAVSACEAFAGPGASAAPAPPQPPAAQPHQFARYAALFLGVWFIYYIGNYAWLTLAPTLLTDRGISLTSSIAYLSVTGIGFFAGALLAIWLGERVERKVTIICTLIGWAIALLVVGIFPQAGVIMAFGFLASLSIGLAVPLMYVYTGEHFSSPNRARGISIGDGIGHIGGAICPYLVLPAAGVSFFLGLAVMAATGVLSAGLVLFGRRTTGRGIT